MDSWLRFLFAAGMAWVGALACRANGRRCLGKFTSRSRLVWAWCCAHASRRHGYSMPTNNVDEHAHYSTRTVGCFSSARISLPISSSQRIPTFSRLLHTTKTVGSRRIWGTVTATTLCVGIPGQRQGCGGARLHRRHDLPGCLTQLD
ncbi:hypothetical protein GGI42DRAFT_225226 [Trichoderma sp. SZMC 28013]